VSGAAGVSDGPFRLVVRVPEDMFSLALEEDERDATATHAAFLDRVLPDGNAREEALEQLAAARRMLKDGGASWLGLAAGPYAGRMAMMLASITVTPFDPPEGLAPAGVLASMLRAEYPADAALIEEFQAPGGPAVGIRRAGTLDLADRHLATGVAQALVVYPEPGALGIVSGICLHPDDLDPVAALVAAIAARMTVMRNTGEAPIPG
jgi:hypothetical protein